MPWIRAVYSAHHREEEEEWCREVKEEGEEEEGKAEVMMGWVFHKQDKHKRMEKEGEKENISTCHASILLMANMGDWYRELGDIAKKKLLKTFANILWIVLHSPNL